MDSFASISRFPRANSMAARRRKGYGYGLTSDVSICAKFTELDVDSTTQQKIIKPKNPATSHRAAPIGRRFDVMLMVALLTGPALAVLKRQSSVAAHMPKHPTLREIIDILLTDSPRGTLVVS